MPNYSSFSFSIFAAISNILEVYKHDCPSTIDSELRLSVSHLLNVLKYVDTDVRNYFDLD